jgi:hypothetical protein
MRLRYSGYLLLFTLGIIPWAAMAIAQDRASFEAVDLDAAVPLA